MSERLIESMTIEEIIDELKSYGPNAATEVIDTPEHLDRRQLLWLSLDAVTGRA